MKNICEKNLQLDQKKICVHKKLRQKCLLNFRHIKKRNSLRYFAYESENLPFFSRIPSLRNFQASCDVGEFFPGPMIDAGAFSSLAILLGVVGAINDQIIGLFHACEAFFAIMEPLNWLRIFFSRKGQGVLVCFYQSLYFGLWLYGV